MTSTAPDVAAKPLIVHVIRRLQIGGMENGLVNLINRLPPSRYDHLIICLTDATDFRRRITRQGVEIIELNRHQDGQDLGLYSVLWRLFRRLKPALVHTRNAATIEAAIAARMAGVPATVHSEHGWDVDDPDGSNKKRQLLRRACKPFIQHFIALSEFQADYLIERIGVDADRLTRLCNGVDVERFRPQRNRDPLPKKFANQQAVIVGTVGRHDPIKDPLALIEAFALLSHLNKEAADNARLVMVGDGDLSADCKALIAKHNMQSRCWLAGPRNDVPALLNTLDIFVLPSRSEGISNSILEAMACGLPVVATHVGGNHQLVDDGVTGDLVPAEDPAALAQLILHYIVNKNARLQASKAARERAVSEFSIAEMVSRYQRVYDQQLAMRRHRFPIFRSTS